MADYSYPPAQELTLAGREKMQTLENDDPIFDYFPIEEKNTSVISWDQEDADSGAQQIRGINGAPKRVKKLGAKRYTVDPGVFGEFDVLDEKELTERGAYGTHGEPVDIEDMVARSQDRLLSRENVRIRMILWLLVTKGQYNLLSETGVLIYAAAFAFPSFTATVAWSSTTTATPIADIRAMKAVGDDLVTSATFGPEAKLFLNSRKVAQLMANTNDSDLGGRFKNVTAGRGLARINEILVEEGLPTIVEVPGGYVDETSGNKVRFVPDDGGVLFGARAEKMGSYTMTRNATNPNSAPGPYDQVIEEKRPPKTIEVHRGHNGGAEVHFGKSIIRLAGI